ncbi:hypothetical protein JTE90_004496 [Oedothorax gibbosus]|uniref:Transient receptor ion channel domain-containing protein n=1 Tax=Oedothorax gibbosus TaxID=931172 RepID=A0AAV6U3L1_9ARAC|nr:hypothetical protein JTE90_004496 [Oedothorax gibbosus]
MAEYMKPLLPKHTEQLQNRKMKENCFDCESKSEPYHRISCVDETLNADEKGFLKMVELGDIDGLKNRLSAKKRMNFDCCDYRGRRALDIAIKRRNITIIQFLLQEIKISALHYYCAMLCAVMENDVYILEILLKRVSTSLQLEMNLQRLVGGGNECIAYLPEVASSNLTPLMVAALEGNVEITKMFLERKYVIKKPHSPHCSCKGCCSNRANTGETLTESMSRMNIYRTLASPTYIILTHHDPILAAFQLSYELDKLSCELPENQKEYKELSRQCSHFAADLLDECRTTEEVKTLLSQKSGCPDERPQKINRFVTAVHYGQKEFVTHPNCQQVLRSIWVEGLPWYSWTSKARLIHVLKQSLLMPIICVSYSIAPKAKMIQAMNIPINRFIYFTASYCMFLFLLLMTLICDRFGDSIKALTTEAFVGLWILGFFLDLSLKFWNGCYKGIGTCVIVIAFSIGMNSIYKYYENSDLCSKSGDYYHHGNEFQTLFQTGNNLFWAIFGKGEPHFADIYNCQNTTNVESSLDKTAIDENRHYFTEAIGYGMWGMYHFIACLVILNMLIGMLAESYQRVQENADMEWKFACSTLWLSVFEGCYLVPPPFNLLPSIEWFTTQYKRFRGTSEKVLCEKKTAQNQNENIEKKAEEEKYEVIYKIKTCFIIF